MLGPLDEKTFFSMEDFFNYSNGFFLTRGPTQWQIKPYLRLKIIF
jgi:hypothetical protein